MKILRVNDFAPNDGFTVFCKGVGELKSDGFAVVAGNAVLTVDGGREGDHGVLNFLLELRRKWLKDHTELIENEQAKLAVNMMLTHGHKDHLPAVWETVRHPFIKVEQVWYPPRAAMADLGTNKLLTFYENQYRTLREELPDTQFTEMTFGEHRSLPLGNARLDLYAPPNDWTAGEYFEIICRENESLKNKNREVTDSNGALNNNSIWGKLTYQGQTVLFTGDQRDTPLALESIFHHHGAEQFKCDILKYIHHGSDRYSQLLTDTARAKIHVFSCPYAEINPKALKACKEYGTVYCTGQGNLILTLNGKTIKAYGIKPLE